MKKEKILLIIFCILLPIFLLLFSYKVVLGLSDLTENQEQTTNFLKGEELNLNYTSSEVSHLEDVKGVMSFNDYLFYFSLLVCTFIITYYKRNKEQLKRLLKFGGIVTLVSIGIILLFALFTFNSTFTIFHKIFFPQGNWIFPTDSLLIQTFPIEFFMGISMKIFGLSLIIGIVFILLSYYLKNVRY